MPYTANYTVAAGTNGSCGPIACGTVLQEKVYGQRAVGQTTAATLNPAYGNIFTGLSNINSNYHGLSLDVTHRRWQVHQLRRNVYVVARA